MSKSRQSHQAGPSFEDEFAGSLGARRLSVEWILTSNKRAFRPPFDIYETDRQFVIKVEIAGMREEDLSVSVDRHVLSISGTRCDSSGKLVYQRMEINYGDFRLEVHLPYEAEESVVEATYDRGFLLVSVPRQPRQRRVPVVDVDSH